MCYADDDRVTETPYTPEIAQDEEILASILAAAEALPKRPARGNFGTDEGEALDGPACAVGLGVLYRGLPLGGPHQVSSLMAFSERYNVSYAYALGVSDGFEGFANAFRASEPMGSDYWRGVRVGAIAAEALL